MFIDSNNNVNMNRLLTPHKLMFWGNTKMGTTDFKIGIEIFEGNNCDHHQLGQKFKYPEDIGQICPWLLDSINSMLRVLQFRGTMPWKYQGTKYEKEIDPDGRTTEFVRCPDPTKAGVVVKITRDKLNTPKEIGWS